MKAACKAYANAKQMQAIEEFCLQIHFGFGSAATLEKYKASLGSTD